MNARFRSMTSCFSAIAGPALVCLVVGGCGSGLDLATVRGTVLVDGEPYANADVVSYPDEGPIAAGRTDAQGAFELVTTGSRGAVPGPHTLTVSPHTNPPVPVPGQPIILPEVPYDPKFRARRYSTLQYEVGPGRNRIVIDLTAGTVREE